jgi:hypothetical protein
VTCWPTPSLRHISRLTDEIGVIEHALGPVPRADLGYCTDDAGRALALAVAMGLDRDAERIAQVTVSFLVRAYVGGGTFRLRRACTGSWTDDPPSDDANGRALLGLGTAAARSPWHSVRCAAASLFDDGSTFRSHHPRAIAYSLLGAVEVLYSDPGNRRARALVADGLDVLSSAVDGSEPWRWPAERLTYANALIPHAVLTAAHVLSRFALVDKALELLDWLVHEETRHGWFSFAPVGGRGQADPRPAFDQQPIEAWAMAEACALASSLSATARWFDATRRAGRWFLGDNDAGVRMFDPATGGGFDGLSRHGANLNQGAESSLAFVATMHTVWALDGLPRTSWLSSGAALRQPRGSAAAR